MDSLNTEKSANSIFYHGNIDESTMNPRKRSPRRDKLCIQKCLPCLLLNISGSLTLNTRWPGIHSTHSHHWFNDHSTIERNSKWEDRVRYLQRFASRYSLVIAGWESWVCPIRGTNLTCAMNHKGGKSVSVVSLTFADQARLSIYLN